MFENRKPVPFFNKGPDPARCYARDIKRWTISGSEGKKDQFKAKVVLRTGWGYRETLAVLAVPVIGVLLFGSMCLAIQHFDPQKESVGLFFLIIVGIFVLQIPFFATLSWVEVSYFNQLPPEVLTIFNSHEFSVDGEKARCELTPGSILRYTIHYPEPDVEGEGSGSYSELDLIIRDGGEEIAVHKLIAYEHNWCWKPAKKLSALSGIPLKRVALQANGKPFPPALPN